MKVKCVKLLDHHGNEKKTSLSLTVGKKYIVLEIDYSFQEAPSYRIIGDQDDQIPAITAERADGRTYKHRGRVLG